MTIFYIDLENGNDASAGTSWETAWKTPRYGATAARIAPGDEIRFAKTGAPYSVGPGVWTDQTKTVTFEPGITKLVDDCESGWIGAANITLTHNTSNEKQGTACVGVNPLAAFTTGKTCYKTFASPQDFSAYQQLSFWHKYSSGSNTSPVFKICLCSDTTGDVVVDEFIVPAYLSSYSGYWWPFTVNKGAPMGSSIQSVAIYATTDPGVPYTYFDFMFACKAPGIGCLTLHTLISKNSAEVGGDEPWMPILSVVDNVATFDWFVSSTTVAIGSAGYVGTSETVVTYARQAVAPFDSSAFYINEGGSSDSNRISFIGGWNKNTDVVDGLTCITNQLYALYFVSGISYVNVSGFAFARLGSGGILMVSGGIGHHIDFQSIVGTPQSGVVLTGTAHRITFGCIMYAGAYGINMSLTAGMGAGHTIIFGIIGATYNQGILLLGYHNLVIGNIIRKNSTSCVAFNPASEFNRVYVNYLKDGGNTCVSLDGAANIVDGAIFSGASSDSTTSQMSDVNAVLRNCTFNNYPALTSYYTLEATGRDRAVNKSVFEGYILESNVLIRHTNSGMSWKLSLTNLYTNYYHVYVPLAKVVVAANLQVTVSLWVYRPNGTLQNFRLMVMRGQIAGVEADIYSAYRSAAIDTWEQLTLSFTPTEAGLVEVCAHAWRNEYALYFDDFDAVQAES